MEEEIRELEKQKEEVSKAIEKLSKIRLYGWIGLIIGFIILPINFGVIIFIALGISLLPVNQKQIYANIEEEIRKKKYEYEHSPEKEKERQDKERERKDKELQERIERVTPFKSSKEKGDYYIAAISWELSNNAEKLKSVNVILKSETKKILKNLYFKYKGKGKRVNATVGVWEETFLDIKRGEIYKLRDEGKYNEATELFREVFAKDPFTGEDLEDNKE